MTRFFLIAASSIVSIFFGVGYANGADSVVPSSQHFFSIHLDESTIKQGYTVTAFDDAIKLSLVPSILSDQTDVQIEEIFGMETPWQLKQISPIYQFEFFNKSAYDPSRPFSIQLKTPERSPDYAQVFFYDKGRGTWNPLPTQRSLDGLYVRSLIHLPYARIAVFAYTDVRVSGSASWYAHKAGHFAASPDFPKGSRIRVHNTENGKYIDVTINDYGPDRLLFPTRVVDLEKRAFQKIASLRDGIISVRIEPLTITSGAKGVLRIPPNGLGAQPIIASKAAIVLDESTGGVLYEKNSNTRMPIASLSKIVALRVFLDTNPNLSDIVTYSIEDEKQTHAYVDYPWEAATLRLKNGDRLSVEDLIYASLVGSANNAVETLVRISGMPRDQFIAKMNAYAESLELSTVHFEEPTGLSPNNASSAYEYALLARAALSHPIIQKASSTRTYSFEVENRKEKRTIKNTNPLLVSGLSVTGSKTGYLHEAGYCLMTRIQGTKGSIIAVTFGDTNNTLSVWTVEDLLRFGDMQLSKRARVKMRESESRAITQALSE